MAGRVGVVGLRGDEAELFRVFNDELVREVRSYVIHDDPDVIVEACAFAWAQFLVHQPDREENWRGWLFRTASRQAWRLARAERRGAVERVSLGSGELVGVVSLVDEIEARQDVVDALSVLSRLDVRLQRVALLRALGLKHAEIAELTGESRTRVDRLLVHAHEAIREVLDERRRVKGRLSPRAARLSELERESPSWLVERIGVQRRPSHKRGVETERRSWRRAALALDDYRAAVGPERFAAAVAVPPVEPTVRRLHARAERALAEHSSALDRGRGSCS